MSLTAMSRESVYIFVAYVRLCGYLLGIDAQPHYSPHYSGNVELQHPRLHLAAAFGHF